MNTVFYLKVNRYEGYTIRCLKRWIEIIKLFSDGQAYIVCDNDELKAWIEKAVDFGNLNYKYINSTGNKKIKEFISDNIGILPSAALAHLTTFEHAHNSGYPFFWNIDADDTRFCLSSERTKELLDSVKTFADDNYIQAFSLDMWTTICQRDPSLNALWKSVWCFGITYVKNEIDWISTITNFSGG